MIIKAYNNELRPNDVNKIVTCLEKGGIIIYPTDSVYAFGCHPNQRDAIERICRLREKDLKRPLLSLVCSDISQAREYTLFNDQTFKLMRSCLPGPYTFILEGSNHLPKSFKERKTVGIRIPDHRVPNLITQALGMPMMTASLRVPDSDDIEYMTHPELIHEKYGGVEILIDGGIGGTIPSTIIDCTGDEPTLVRQGLGDIDL